MPTPSDETFQHPSVEAQYLERSAYTTCPPEHGRSEAWRTHNAHSREQDGMSSDQASAQQPSLLSGGAEISGLLENDHHHEACTKLVDAEQDRSSTDGMSPMSMAMDVKDGEQRLSPSPMPPSDTPPSSSSTNYKFSNIRVLITKLSECLAI